MTFAESYRTQLLQALSSVDMAKVDQAIALFDEARANKRHVFMLGNGGSGSTASHIVCDFVKGASYNRPSRFRILSLGDSSPTISAYSNDVCYECVFEEQLKNFAEKDDVVVALSGSGNSENVIRAVEYANSIGCKTISLTGRDGGKLGSLANLDIRVGADHMGRIEDAHMMICHIIAYRFIEN